MKEQIDFSHLSQQQASDLLNVDRRTLRRWETDGYLGNPLHQAPRNADGTYNSGALIWWAIACKVHIAR